ncbi:hypothetical protein MWU31_17000 [Aeromonas hydrophila]|uniref:hypothetical protein n=1 Tax=Aeromonas hydrophila TaxID=644 RepID=UPI001FF5BAE1|nr:hypothetical protein [Aeromonas hydrophila]MCK0186923.1 hypothetical protein [Aeromonas hydrophila]UOV92912.1 hypothetical protein MUW98_04600 [Aeromonas hydrophila]
MRTPNKNYDGKPTAYLDHNILDIFVKNRDLPFASELREKYQIIYSDETLKEIKRTGDSGSKFLEVLECLEAMHLRIFITESFKITDKAILKESNPFDAFEDYCKNIEPVYEAMEKATAQSLLKFYGGRAGSDFDDINREQIDSFSHLMNYISDQVDEIKDLVPGIEAAVSAHTKEMQNSFNEALAQSTAELRKHIEDELNYSGVQTYRNHMNIGPVQLNNIEPPSVIEQIWSAYKTLDSHRENNYSIEQFLGISKNPIYNREMYLHEKVTSVYNVLNVIGYYPDSKMKHDRRFTAAMSDAGHAAIASFSDFLFSRDSAFIHKTRAAYEYLNVKTQVIEVIVNDV